MEEMLRFIGFSLASMAIFWLAKDLLTNWHKDSEVDVVEDDEPRRSGFEDKKEPQDQLASLEGITSKMLPALAKAKIVTYSDLELADEQEVMQAVHKDFPDVSMSEVKLWIRQASLAEQERWDELESLKQAMQKARTKIQ